MSVSIVIPVYNAQKYIEDTLHSILNQTLPAQEIILINDGSQDSSWKILQQFAKHHCQLKIFNQENAGPSITRNRGVEYATSEWICFVDADDLLHPQRLEIASKFTQGVDAVICDFERFKNNEKLTIETCKTENISSLSIEESNKMVLKYGYGLPRMLMKKTAYLNSGGLDVSLVNNEDHELHFRMLTQGVKFKKVEASLYYYRQHHGESRLSNQENKIQYIYRALDKMASQITALPLELQSLAKAEIGNRIASNALKQARLGQSDYKIHLKKAKILNPQLKPYNRDYQNIISKLLGFGNIETLISRLK